MTAMSDDGRCADQFFGQTCDLPAEHYGPHGCHVEAMSVNDGQRTYPETSGRMTWALGQPTDRRVP